MWRFRRLTSSSNQNKNPHKSVTLREDAMYVLALVGPVMTIPQVYQIWTSKDASGLAPMTWVTYLCLSVFWLYHALKVRDKLLIVNNVLNIFVNIFIVTGIFLYI
jgi:uncharacterized protein with PQ loop repeat